MVSAQPTTWPTGVRVVYCVVCVLLVLCGPAGCKDSEKQRTTLFQEAEKHYQSGEYDAALDDYQVFLERYPRSRLAETARLRIRSINREIQSMMSRDDMPTPIYRGDESNSEGTSTEPVDPSTDRDAGSGAEDGA